MRAAVPGIRQLPPAAGTASAPPERALPARAKPRGRRARTRRHRLPWVVAAAATALALVLGGAVGAMGVRMQQMREHTAEVERLLAASDASVRDAPLDGGDARASVVTSQRSGTVLVMVEGLPPAPEGMGYQLWYVEDSGTRSAGMLADTGGGMYSGMARGLGSAERIGISLEPAGGMPEPSHDPMTVEL
ncbi:anti-sigma factor [Streptomonospora sp. NEAU-YY374]|nr:anti-sigma factor [Streptomonospora nanhaiensis]MBV2367051.1 anti-sigma factor [Streptomonospora nanhaiensis]